MLPLRPGTDGMSATGTPTYLGGFSPEWADHSVGNVLLGHTIRAAIEEGAHTYELLRGDEGYKSRFETGRREIDTIVLVPAASPMRTLVWLEREIWRRRNQLPHTLEQLGRSAYDKVRALSPTGHRR